MAARDHTGPQFEQLALFDKKVGTGMHDDPDNKALRMRIVKQMLPEVHSGYAKEAVKTLNKSKVPLQHLSDIRHSGTKITAHNSSFDTSFYRFSFDGSNPQERTIVMNPQHATDSFSVVHEVGHALHDTLSAQFRGGDGAMARDFIDRGYSSHRGPDATTEGIADGYAERYARGRGDMSGKGYPVETFTKEGAEEGERYTHARSATLASGKVPISGKILMPRTQPAPKGEQLSLDL